MYVQSSFQGRRIALMSFSWGLGRAHTAQHADTWGPGLGRAHTAPHADTQATCIVCLPRQFTASPCNSPQHASPHLTFVSRARAQLAAGKQEVAHACTRTAHTRLAVPPSWAVGPIPTQGCITSPDVGAAGTSGTHQQAQARSGPSKQVRLRSSWSWSRSEGQQEDRHPPRPPAHQ